MRKYSKRRTFIDQVDVNVREFDVSADHSFDYYVGLFMEQTTAKGRSKDTLLYYRKTLDIWRSNLEELGLSTNVNDITTDNIRKFIHHYTVTKGNKYTAAMTQLRGVRTFANFLLKEGIIETHGFLTFPLQSENRAELDVLSDLDVILLLEQCDTSTFTGLRNYMIILTLIETGIRLRELSDIRLKDVNLDDRVIAIHGKNGQLRYVPFQQKYARRLRSYLRVRGICDTDALFITQDNGKMSRRTIQQALSKLGKQAGITDKRVSPHTFRHTFAKSFIKNGGNIFALQRILGHSTLDMVRVYVNLFSCEVDEEHRKASPLNNIIK